MSDGTFTMQSTTAVIERVGESKSDNEVSALFAIALGEPSGDFDPAPSSVHTAAFGEPLSGQVLELRAEGSTVQFIDTFPTYPDHKVRLNEIGSVNVPRFVEHDSQQRHQFPLVLLSPSSPKTINSMFAEFQKLDPSVRLHPDDAATRGLANGDDVEVFNDRATIATVVKFDEDLQCGVAVMPKGAWCRDYAGGLTANALTPDSFSDLADGACFNDTLVEVRRR